MKRVEAKSLAEIIDKAFQSTDNPEAFDRQRLCSLWGEVVGQGINRMTIRRFVEGSTLHVFLTSAVLKQELSFERQRLVEALNRAVGREVIDEIRFH
ncbi:MAG: DUF721 domain-containing protein [Muribaculaceae bacterium]|nr:DUF721 domain-containing protein [Muribaculaceae bacterium]